MDQAGWSLAVASPNLDLIYNLFSINLHGEDLRSGGVLFFEEKEESIFVVREVLLLCNQPQMAGQCTTRSDLERILFDETAEPVPLPLSLLREITGDFSAEQKIGTGGFATVYKGKLENGMVAVKNLHNTHLHEKEFLREVECLMMARHKNVVRFLGYCSDTQGAMERYQGKLVMAEKRQRLLCFEYVPKGDLHKYINDASGGLDWTDRYRIIKGIVEGLHYLHQNKTVHLDLKPKNILLDHNMVPKIADFGLSRYVDEKQSKPIASKFCGTIGYLPPDFDNHLITHKFDLFSLGVIITEILTGKRECRSVENVLETWRNRLDISIGDTEFDQVRECAKIGIKCCKTNALERPTTEEIMDRIKRTENMDESRSSKVQTETAFNELHHYTLLLMEEKSAEEYGRRKTVPTREPPPPELSLSRFRTCAGCKNPIGPRFIACMYSVWHTKCFRCCACNKPISEHEFATYDGQPYHKSCHKDCFHPKCDVCKNFIPTNKNGLIEYRAHPFWMQKYCPSHEDDGTPRCCSCERMEPADIKYITLDDGRNLCFECLNSSTMDSQECQHLYMDIQKFFEGLNMKVEEQVPLLLVDRQTLSEALEAAKSGHHPPETQGLCLSEEQIVRTILRRPTVGPENRIMDMVTGPYKLALRCEVTAILILYGLPRLLTGSILAHEMMHAYLRLKGYRSLSPQVEEGICQVLSHMWLESKIIVGSSGNIASTSVSSSSSAPSTSSSNKVAKTEFEKKLGALFKNQIETDSSMEYGDGFRAGNQAVQRNGLRTTLDHMRLAGSFCYSSPK